MRAKISASKASAKHQLVLIHDSINVPPMITKTITAFVEQPSEWHTSGTVTPVGKITETAFLLKSLSMSTTIDKKTAIRVTNTTELRF